MIASVMLLSLCACGNVNKEIYAKAEAAFEAGNYSEAAALFRSVSDYEDSEARVKECNYFIACAELDNDHFEEAIELFTALGDYRDCAKKLAEATENIFDSTVVGTWLCESIDMVDAVKEGILSSMGESGEEFLSYFPMMEFVVDMRLELFDDGKYSVSLDADSFDEAKTGLVAELREGFGDYVMALFKTMLDSRGMTIEEYEQSYGQEITPDVLIFLFYEITMDELMEEMSSELDTISIDSFAFSGEYRADESHVRMILNDNVSVADYSAESDLLVFPDEGDNSAMFYNCCPLTFVRVQ